MTDLMNVCRSLAVALGSLPVCWADPSRSPGSTTIAVRVLYTGYLPPNRLTSLDLKMLIANLRNLHVPPTTLLASEALLAEAANAVSAAAAAITGYASDTCLHCAQMQLRLVQL